MNPFLVDPVAKPLSTAVLKQWNTTAFVQGKRRPFRYRAGRLVVAAAGLGAGLSAGFSAYALDVNAASLTELEKLRGVGPRTAQMIIQERMRAGAFESFADLSDRVRGLGPQRVKSLQSAGLRVGVASDQSAVSRPSTSVPDISASVRSTATRDAVTPVVMPGVIIPVEKK